MVDHHPRPRSSDRPATHAALVRVRLQAERRDEGAEVLDAVRRLAERDERTTATFLLRFGDGGHGLLELFAEERDRRAHLTGPARQAIAYRARDLFAGAPDEVLYDVAARELPSAAACARLGAGVWSTFPVAAPSGSTPDAGTRLRVTRPWLALRSAGGPLVVVTFAADPSATPIPPRVHRDGSVVRPSSVEAFRLLGPDVPEDPTDGPGSPSARSDDEAATLATVTELRLRARDLDLDLTH